jgi:RNA polymerase sigma-70 factor (ECF subfamily)
MQSGGGRTPRGGFGADFERVLEAARAGRAEAWERLYRALAPAVTGYLRMQGAAEPDDLASEVFLGVFRGISRFTGDEGAFRSWVFVIAHRRLQDERRRRFRGVNIVSYESAAVAATVGSAEDDALRELATDRVRTVCAQLAPDQRDVVLLRILGDLTVDQVADVLGKSLGAVKQLQRRGVEAIRRLSPETIPTRPTRQISRPEGVPL